MRDQSRTPEPQPPNDRSTDVKSVVVCVLGGGVVVLDALGALGVLDGGVGSFVGALSIVVVLSVLDVGNALSVSDIRGILGILGGGIGGGVLGGGIGIGIIGGVLLASGGIGVLRSGNIGNVVRGISRLRLTLRQTGAVAPFAVAVWIGGRGRRWQAEDWQAALAESPRPIRYSLGLVSAATRMRLYDLGGLLVKAARWVLASNRRTWWPLAPLLTFAAVNIHLSQGWGSAFYTLPTIVGFHLGVEWLRHRWGIELKPRPPAGDPGRDQ